MMKKKGGIRRKIMMNTATPDDYTQLAVNWAKWVCPRNVDRVKQCMATERDDLQGLDRVSVCVASNLQYDGCIDFELDKGNRFCLERDVGEWGIQRCPGLYSELKQCVDSVDKNMDVDNAYIALKKCTDTICPYAPIS
jgi:hypothetical protein